MAIDRLVIEGYRSIAELDLRLGPLNALIGANNAGKSNILRALNLILGETYPTRPFSERDRHGHDPNRAIAISVAFDTPLHCDNDVLGFKLEFTVAGEIVYSPIDQNGDPCQYYRGREKRISKAMRDEVTLLYLGLDRQAEKQLRFNSWTIYGKLLRKIDEGIGAADRAAFTATVEAAVNANLRPALVYAQTVISDFVQRQTGLDTELNFRAVDPLDVLAGVRPYVIDTFNFDPEDVGSGVQSALTVAIAKAYADVVHQPLILAIEEPELFLHPHGCRHFYSLLNELAAGNLQIIYTTHERGFVDAGQFEQIHIVRKSAGRTGRGFWEQPYIDHAHRQAPVADTLQ